MHQCRQDGENQPLLGERRLRSMKVEARKGCRHPVALKYILPSVIAILAIIATALAITLIKPGSAAKHGANNIKFSPIQPPSYPLAVRNPYLSAWLPGPQVTDLPAASPQFWAGNSLSWSIIARVDGTTYNLFGVPRAANGTESAVLLAVEYTSTQSIFTLRAGPAKVELNFFSPVSPSNYLRQSLPFSYLTITASSTLGSKVQVYSDIDNSWTGRAVGTSWNLTQLGETSVFSMSAENTEIYTQNSNDQALWGETIFASRPTNSSKLTVQSGNRSSVREGFISNGSLTGQTPSWSEGSVIALSHDLGDVYDGSSVTLAIGYVREEAVNYLGTPYTGYYRAQYPETADAVSYFLDDLTAAQSEAQVLDSDVASKANLVGGSNYSDIVTLSMRQAYGGIDLVIPNETLDPNGLLAFIKEISSDGNVNTMDIIYPAFPIYYIMDPEYIRLLLEPVVQYLESGRWKLPYTIHDIGSNYPNATGHDNGKAEAMPIEESGNLLILAYAYTLATGNSTWALNHTTLFQKYADYLVSNSINISLQLSTTDAAGPLTNETNVAVKAAVGLKAFGALTGMQNYTSVGEAHAHLIYNDGLSTDAEKTHFVLQYPDADSSYKVTFNLFPDVLLNLSTFPQSAYDMESTYYPAIRKEAGVAIDNRQWWGKTDWNIWAASVSSNSTRDMFVNDIWAYLTNGMNSWPFSDRWVVSDSGVQSGHDQTIGPAPKPVGSEFALRARPTVGGHFALLALKGARYLKW